jgi:hypothetical protein
MEVAKTLDNFTPLAGCYSFATAAGEGFQKITASAN